MIENFGNQLLLEFGSGNIACVLVKVTNNKTGQGNMMLAFANCEAQPVGSELQAQPESIADYPVLISFSCAESVDVIIKMLEEAKEYLRVLEEESHVN